MQFLRYDRQARIKHYRSERHPRFGLDSTKVNFTSDRNRDMSGREYDSGLASTSILCMPMGAMVLYIFNYYRATGSGHPDSEIALLDGHTGPSSI